MFTKPLTNGTVYYAEEASDTDLGVVNAIKTYSGIVGYGNKNKMIVNSDGSLEVNTKALDRLYDWVTTYPRGTDPVRRTSSGIVAAYPCELASIMVTAATSGTITFFDSPSTNANQIGGTLPVTAGQIIPVPHGRFYNGLYVVFGGTGVDALFWLDPSPLI